MTITYNSTYTVSRSDYSEITTAVPTSSTYIPFNETSTTERVETIFVYRASLAAHPVIRTLKQDEISTGVPVATTASASPLTLTSVAPSATSERGTSNQEGLSSGTKAGIGIGVALGVCALVSLCLFFLYRSRKRKTTRGENSPGWRTPELSNKPMEVKELSDDTMGVKELSNDAIKAQELPSNPRPEVNKHQTVAQGRDE